MGKCSGEPYESDSPLVKAILAVAAGGKRYRLGHYGAITKVRVRTLHEMRFAHTFSNCLQVCSSPLANCNSALTGSVSTYTFKRARSCSSRRSVAPTTLSSASQERSFFKRRTPG